MKHQVSHFVVALAASADAGGVPTEIQLLPAGAFRATDGRPEGLDAWRLDPADAEKLLLQAANRANPFLIDFEHQTLLAKTNGQPAPAAGWFTALSFRPESGLWATGVQWTARAAAMAALLAWAWALLAGMVNPTSPRAHRTLIGYDQTLNAALGGDPDETISSRAHRAQIAGQWWGCTLCRVLDVLHKDHCKNSANS